ncbi:hypothetical protein [Mucilaginibacter sp.]|uniref:hypothetical protein n=1 Tax=Mucilaginibacter sp. TaxID=1882438 RepID=UPI003564520B
MKIWNNYLFNFIVLCLLSCILIWLTDKFILTSEFFSRNGQYLSGSPDQELMVYNLLQKWIYASAITYLAVRIIAVSLILYTALYLLEVSVSFQQVLRIVTLSEYVFLLPAATKFLHFYFLEPVFTLEDWHRYYALSALMLVSEIPADWHYALQAINIFEVAYWFLLAAGIHKETGMNYDSSLKVVIRFYLPAFLIWICLLTFSAVIYFPATS